MAQATNRNLKKILIEAIPYGVAVVCVFLGFFLMGLENQGRGGHLLWEVESTLTSCQLEWANHLVEAQGQIEQCLPVPAWAEVLLVVLLVCGGAFLSWNASASCILWTGALGVLLLQGADLLLLYGKGIDIPLTVPLGCTLLACVICIFVRWSRDQVVQHETQEERDHLGRVFEKMLSSEVAQEVWKRTQNGTLETEGSRSEVTVLFADIRGFTELTTYEHARDEATILQKKLSPKEAEKYRDQQGAQLLRTINIYLSAISEIVMSHGGTLDKYIGDCVMAFWGEPTPNPQHARDAVRAAVAIQEKIFALNRDRQKENRAIEAENALAISKGESQRDLLALLPVGIGVNTGEVIVGFMGSKKALAYTVLGSPVNLASRLERLAGMGKILIGASTYEHLRREDPQLVEKCVEMEPSVIKGFQEKVRYYEVGWKTREMAIEEWGWNWGTGD